MTRAPSGFPVSEPHDEKAGRIRTIEDIRRYLTEELPSSGAAVLTGGLGRRRVRELLGRLGDPQDAVRSVHVAGTAGKGSVCAFVTAVLREHGFHVGTSLSPHVYSLLERFQLDGGPAPVRDVAAALEEVRDRETSLSGGPWGAVSMFEAATAAAFLLFRDHEVDYAVLETGLGGLHDATNTITRPDKLAVLTAIGLDHTALLGRTSPEIARQKAGILPEGGVAVALRGSAEVDQVFAAEAALRGCRLDQVDPARIALPDAVRPGLPGRHQRVNAALAVHAVRCLAERDGWRLDPERIAEGVRRVRLPGRFERRRWRGHPVVLDGAHNPMKLASLVDAVRDEWPGRAPVWVLTVKPDKDLDTALEVVSPAAAAVIATEFSTSGRGRPGGVPASAEEVATAARRAGARAVAEPNLSDALDSAVELSDPDLPVIVSGSFHVVADAVDLGVS